MSEKREQVMLNLTQSVSDVGDLLEELESENHQLANSTIAKPVTLKAPPSVF